MDCFPISPAKARTGGRGHYGYGFGLRQLTAITLQDQKAEEKPTGRLFLLYVPTNKPTTIAFDLVVSRSPPFTNRARRRARVRLKKSQVNQGFLFLGLAANICGIHNHKPTRACALPGRQGPPVTRGRQPLLRRHFLTIETRDFSLETATLPLPTVLSL